MTEAEKVLHLYEKAQREMKLGDQKTFWRPVLTEQQKQEQDEYIKLNNLPF